MIGILLQQRAANVNRFIQKDIFVFMHLLQLAGGILLLWFGAGWIVDSAAAIARRLRISELVIGLTVVAMGTSAPEFLVTATAAFKGMADISLANVVGSNIFNLGMILGIMALIRPIPTHPVLLYRDGLTLLAVCLLVTGLCLDLYIGRPAGVLLLTVFAGYLGFLLVRARKSPLSGAEAALVEEVPEREATWVDGLKLLAGFAGITLGSHLLVEGASAVAAALGVSQWAIGLTIVAAGTSLPELVTCLAAALKGKNDMLLGNLLGSDFFNFAGVLGVTCLLRPLTVSDAALPSLYVLAGAVLLVLVFMRTGWRISRLEGVVLILVNLGRWAMELRA